MNLLALTLLPLLEKKTVSILAVSEKEVSLNRAIGWGEVLLF